MLTWMIPWMFLASGVAVPLAWIHSRMLRRCLVGIWALVPLVVILASAAVAGGMTMLVFSAPWALMKGAAWGVATLIGWAVGRHLKRRVDQE